MSATLAEDASGRWSCSFQVIVQRSAPVPERAGAGTAVVGVDVGVKADALLVVAAPDGREIARVPAPKSLAAAQARLRALQRKVARQHGPWDPAARTRQPPSRRRARTSKRIGRVHAHAAAIRRDVLHKQTTALARRHQVITVETLNASGMRSAGDARKRGLNRALADAALAEVRRMLRYKCAWYGSTLVEAGRYYPSSKTCSGCGSRKPRLSLAERAYACDRCGLVIDRDLNAAINLARLGEAQALGEQGPAGSGPVAGRGATRETGPARAGDAGGREASTPRRQPPGKTGTAPPQGEAA
ncbi:MAG: transposase [Nocardiopsaceae bacterium]|nr:transposase [Nocardiopsaceae bacterium]